MRSNYYHGKYLKGWNKRMLREDDMDDGVFDKHVIPVLTKIKGEKVPENHQYRSRYSYSALMVSVNNYFKTPNSSQYLNRGVAIANRMFAAIPKHPLDALYLDSPDFYEKAEIKGDKSAGLTNFGKSKAESAMMAWGYAHQILNGKTPHPCLAGYRTQNTQIQDSEGHYLPKTRLVWMYPEEMTYLEAIIGRPLLQYFTTHNTQMSFGHASAFEASKFQHCKNQSNWIVGTDQSKFDQHVREVDIHAAFQYFRRFFDMHQVIDDEGHTVSDVFKIVERYFIYTPLVFPSHKGPQKTTDKDHGVPSGSFFTQMLDSFVNYALTVQLFLDLKVKFSPSSIFVLGDDMIAFTYSKTTVREMHERAAYYGYNIHDDEKSEVKSASESDFDYLGRTWIDCVPTRDFQDVVDHAEYPERWRDYRHADNVEAQVERVVYSYGLTAVIRGVRWRRGYYLHLRPQDFSGLSRFMAEELHAWTSPKGIAAKIY